MANGNLSAELNSTASASLSGALSGSVRYIQGPAGEGGYYLPKVEDGILTWIPSSASLPAAESANVMGPAGKDGKDGRDGADGAKGDQGEPGAAGKDGYTPIKGVDYWTSADKNEMREYVLDTFREEDLPEIDNAISQLEDKALAINITVHGGTSAPASPNEGDIWVNTSAAITSWTYYAAEPANPAEGKVWLQASAGIAIDTLASGNIAIYPAAAKQYISGLWADVEGKVYRGGEWLAIEPPYVHLYINGDECVAVSGGFAAHAYKPNGISSTSVIAPTLTKNADSMVVSLASYYYGAVFNEAAFAIDDIANIEVVYSSASGSGLSFLVTQTKGQNYVAAAKATPSASSGTATIDVSGLAGNYYFAIEIAGSGGSVTIHEIRLNKEATGGAVTPGGGGVSPEAIEQAVKNYLEANPIEETDPTVPEWAKQPEKPEYTAAEVGAQPVGDYAEKDQIPTKVSQLDNDEGYISGYTETDPTVPAWAKASSKPSYSKSEVGLGNVDNVKQYSASNPPPYPVTKVNNKTGAVTLSASDVGARESDWMPSAADVGAVPTTRKVNSKALSADITLSASDVGARPSTWTPTYSDVGADKSGTASTAVSTHNTNTAAHNDIRLLITGLTTRLDALANSDDTTLDQMAEIVAYIKANRDLIDQITTGKVSVSDIVNNLTTNVTNKPLSAAQGVALKALIDAITVPTKLSELADDSTHRTVTDAEKTAWTAKLNASELGSAIEDALDQAKASGEFDGATGKTAYAYAQDGGYTGTEAEFAEKLAAEIPNIAGKVDNPLYGKGVTFNGDSICYGSGYVGGYGKIIAERNNMTYENLGGGGATVTAEMYTSSGEARRWLCRTIDDMDAAADYAILEGGVNDAWNSAPMGSLTSGYSATLDDTTYYGAFESMLKQLIIKYQGKKYGYIITPKMTSLFANTGEANNYYYAALECCAKWGVPVCDLNVITPDLSFGGLSDVYTIDGTHPNEAGYKAYYCDQIEAWMRTLTTGGNNIPMLAKRMVVAHNNDTTAHPDIRALISALQNGKLNNTGVSFRKALLPLADGTTLEIDVLTAVDGTVVIPYVNRVPLSIDTDGSVFNTIGYQEGKRLSSSGAIKDGNGCVVTGYIPAKAGDVVRVWDCDWATTLNAYSYICAYDANFVFIGGYATVAGGSFSLTKYGTAISASHSSDDSRNLTMTLANVSNIAYVRVSTKGNTAGNYATFAPENMIVTINEEIPQ